MRLKLYRAAEMAQAMARVRTELGEDALILATRRVGDGIEITAALEPEEPSPTEVNSLLALDYHGVPATLRNGDPLATLTFGHLPLDTQPVLFVGPPGAGKTLTVARLATRLVMAGTMPMVITADGKRAGATEQLVALTRLLDVKVVVACHPVTLGRALARRPMGVPVLIDTPGCNAFDEEQVLELSELAAVTAGAVVLVLPAGLDPAEAADIAHAYAAFGTTMLIPTRLDLTRRLGGVLAAASVGLALTEAGIGPGAADGLLPITREWLTARLLTGPHA